MIRDAPLLRCDDDSPEDKRIDRLKLAASVAHYRKWIAWSVVIIYGLGVFSLGAWGSWGRVKSWWFGSASKTEPLTFDGAMVGLAGALVLVIVFGWVVHRLTPRARCPHCQQLLDSLAGHVLATGNCSHCGRRVLKSDHAIGLHAKS